jgi:hypothetical protein
MLVSNLLAFTLSIDMLLNDQLPSAVVEACPPVANAAELIIPPHLRGH